MCLKKLRKEETIPFDHDFNGWTEECLKLNRDVIEETIKEAHNRENVIYSRVGSLLALDGVILAVVCTLISRMGIASDSVPACLLTAGICILILSVLILGYLLIPPTRRGVNPKSCESDKAYSDNCRNGIELQKVISRDRVNVSEDTASLLMTMSVHFSLAIIFSAAGLGMIGFAMIFSMINGASATAVCAVMTAVIIIFLSSYWKRAKV
jgi:hypothetical protein